MKKELKLEAGKLYISRDGREFKVYLKYSGVSEDDFRRYHGAPASGQHWRFDGRAHPGYLCPYDLISVKPEGPKLNPHAELIKAWADGAVIQGRSGDFTEWGELSPPGAERAPGWFVDFHYRVKPEEPRKWNHLFSIGFSVISTSEDPGEIT